MDPSDLAKLLNLASPELRAQILAVLSQPNPSLTVASPNTVDLGPSGGSFAAIGSSQPLLPPQYTPSAQHQVPSTSPSPGLALTHESPKGSMKIKTGGGGAAKGLRAIGGNGGDIGPPDAKSGKDSVNLGAGEARAGDGGRIQSLGMLIDAHRTFADVDFETGVGGGAESTETTHYQTNSNDPSKS